MPKAKDTRTYSEKLKDPRWQKKRLDILHREDFVCEFCGEPGKTVHVHHLFYLSNREPWDYPDWVLRVLCEECHEKNCAEEKFMGFLSDCFENRCGPDLGLWGIQRLIEMAASTGLGLFAVSEILSEIGRFTNRK